MVWDAEQTLATFSIRQKHIEKLLFFFGTQMCVLDAFVFIEWN